MTLTDIQTKQNPKLTRADFPEVAEDRFFSVVHNPKSVSTPVTIELREYLSEGAMTAKRTGVSRLLGRIYTTAEREKLLDAAATLHSRVNNIDNVVGTY